MTADVYDSALFDSLRAFSFNRNQILTSCVLGMPRACPVEVHDRRYITGAAIASNAMGLSRGLLRSRLGRPSPKRKS